MKNVIAGIAKQVYNAVFLLILITNPGCKKNTPAPPSTEKTFYNPLVNNGPDPYVIKSGSAYYYTNTLGNRLGIWKTTAMSKLSTAVYTTVFSPAVSGPNSHNLWAPEFHILNNKWYLYYTAGDGSLNTQRTFVLENLNRNGCSLIKLRAK